MQPQTTGTLADRLVEAFNASDWDAVRATLHPGVVYDETGTGRHTEGIDAYLELLRGWKVGMPDVSGTVERSVSDGDVTVQDIRWTGTQTGALATPGGTIPPTQRRFAVQATLWVVSDGSRIRGVAHHLDVLSLLQQLGALPGAG